MSPSRNTRTGGVLEAMVLPALDQGKYVWNAQVNIGQRLGCGRHYVDAIAEKNDRKFLIPRYAFDYGNCGWETRLRGIFERSLASNLGRV